MDLVTCAYCGHDRPQTLELDDQPGDAYAVFCEECGTHGQVDTTAALAEERWNKRVPAT